mmetsp:Transcript_2986/g.9915  ORF Transcript_2986/g.9915 Transcript_2986/m.9915 type:complete len:362 (-) Transcript_2986:132-1217(-)
MRRAAERVAVRQRAAPHEGALGRRRRRARHRAGGRPRRPRLRRGEASALPDVARVADRATPLFSRPRGRGRGWLASQAEAAVHGHGLLGWVHRAGHGAHCGGVGRGWRRSLVGTRQCDWDGRRRAAGRRVRLCPTLALRHRTAVRKRQRRHVARVALARRFGVGHDAAIRRRWLLSRPSRSRSRGAAWRLAGPVAAALVDAARRAHSRRDGRRRRRRRCSRRARPLSHCRRDGAARVACAALRVRLPEILEVECVFCIPTSTREDTHLAVFEGSRTMRNRPYPVLKCSSVIGGGARPKRHSKRFRRSPRPLRARPGRAGRPGSAAAASACARTSARSSATPLRRAQARTKRRGKILFVLPC